MSSRYLLIFEFSSESDDEAAEAAADLLSQLRLTHAGTNLFSSLSKQETQWKLLAEPIMSREQLEAYREDDD